MVERAHRDARKLDVPPFCLQAADQRHKLASKTLDQQITHNLLTIPNLHKTGKLQGMLLIHEQMVVRLTDVLSSELGLVKDKLGRVVSVELHGADKKRLANLPPGYTHFFPDFMVTGIWAEVQNFNGAPLAEHLQAAGQKRGLAPEQLAKASSLLLSSPTPSLA